MQCIKRCSMTGPRPDSYPVGNSTPVYTASPCLNGVRFELPCLHMLGPSALEGQICAPHGPWVRQGTPDQAQDLSYCIHHDSFADISCSKMALDDADRRIAALILRKSQQQAELAKEEGTLGSSPSPCLPLCHPHISLGDT